MEQLFMDKDGEGEFNCQPVQLTLNDLDDLEVAIKENALPDTQGFFFGNNPPDDESNEDDLEFICAARKVIAEGDAVYYSAWY